MKPCKDCGRPFSPKESYGRNYKNYCRQCGKARSSRSESAESYAKSVTQLISQPLNDLMAEPQSPEPLEASDE